MAFKWIRPGFKNVVALLASAVSYSTFIVPLLRREFCETGDLCTLREEFFTAP
jgi:hypothetical protein